MHSLRNRCKHPVTITHRINRTSAGTPGAPWTSSFPPCLTLSSGTATVLAFLAVTSLHVDTVWPTCASPPHTTFQFSLVFKLYVNGIVEHVFLPLASFTQQYIFNGSMSQAMYLGIPCSSPLSEYSQGVLPLGSCCLLRVFPGFNYLGAWLLWTFLHMYLVVLNFWLSTDILRSSIAGSEYMHVFILLEITLFLTREHEFPKLCE